MSAAAFSEASPFRPYAPEPRDRRANTLLHLWLLSPNPNETWTKEHYEDSINAERTVLGRVTVVNDPAAIRRIFVDNAENYPKDQLQQRILQPGLGDGLLTASGDAWKRARRTLSPLFTPKRVASLAGVMRDCAERRIDRWLKRRPGAILEIDREMTAVTFDILSATLFSDALAEDFKGFERAMTRYIESIGRVDPLDVLGAPAWIPRIGRMTARPALAFFEQAVTKLVSERHALVAQNPTAAPDDILTALLKASDPETGVGLTEPEVAANIITFIAAGHETTARALAWTLHLIAHAPGVRAAVEAEAQAAPDDPADWVDELPLVRACLEESMRLFPPAPLLSRAALEDDRLRHVDVEAGTLVVVAPWLLHRHKRLWTDPEAFMPERFLPGARDAIDRFAYLPFGAGPRICIGARFAMMEAVIMLAAVLRRVRLDPVDGPPPRPVHRITLRPAGRLAMSVRPRAGEPSRLVTVP
ncbi:MAG: cytochrome P450 [Beijerinckiaceae bacterium]